MSEELPPQSSKPSRARNGLDKPWWVIIAAAALAAMGTAAVGGIPSLMAWARSFFPVNATLFLSVRDTEQHSPMSGVRFSVIDTRNNARLRLTDAVGDVAVSNDGLAHLSVRVMPGLGYVIEASYALQGETFATTIPVAIHGDLQQEIMFDRTTWYTAKASEYVGPQSTVTEGPAQGPDLPPWMKIAYGELGQKETGASPGNPRILEYLNTVIHGPVEETNPWNSAFVNWVMKTAGYANTGSPMARSWLNWGVPENPPTPGCIAVFWTGSPTSLSGHVAFYRGDASPDAVEVLGGNQHDEVSIARISKSRLLGCRLPT